MIRQKSVLTVIFTFLANLALVACKTPVAVPEHKLHGWKPVPEDQWPSKETSTISFKIGLEQQNLGQLEQILLEISSPNSPKFGQWLTSEQVGALVAPADEDINHVIEWIESSANSGAISMNAHRDFVLITDMKVTDVENLFDTQLAYFCYPGLASKAPFSSDKCIWRSKYYLDFAKSSQAKVPAVVEMVDGVHNFYPMRPAKEMRSYSESEFPGAPVNPLLIKELYGIDYTANAASTKSTQAVAEFEQAYFYPQDLVNFLKNFSLPPQEMIIVGPNCPNCTESYLGEASLDVEYITAIGTGVKSWDISIGDNGMDLIKWAAVVTSLEPNGPYVHSISWGSGESGFDKDTMTRTSNEFLKLTTQGHTIFTASGDDGTGHTGLWCGTFDPNFPATIPYSIAVGGTYFDSKKKTEIGWSGSGGGFSTVFPAPNWQKTTVASYLKKPDLPEQSYFNPSGRAIPDLSALSTNFAVLIQSYMGTLTGTSAATPTVAAMFSLVNDIRLSNGKSRLGFISPQLWNLTSSPISPIGYDVTSGQNDAGECPKGFPATTGWDAITGWGTPRFPIIKKLFG